MFDGAGNDHEYEPLPSGFLREVAINAVALVLIFFLATELVLLVAALV